MKAMMIDVVNHCDVVLASLFSTPLDDKLIEQLGRQDLVPDWNDPEWAQGIDHKPRVARHSPVKRKLKRRGTDKVRGRSISRKERGLALKSFPGLTARHADSCPGDENPPRPKQRRTRIT
jgi:hypothetical protein